MYLNVFVGRDVGGIIMHVYVYLLGSSYSDYDSDSDSESCSLYSASPAMQQAIKCPQLSATKTCMKIANEKEKYILFSFYFIQLFVFGHDIVKQLYNSPRNVQGPGFILVLRNSPRRPNSTRTNLKLPESSKHLENLLCRCKAIKLVSIWNEVVWQRGVCLILFLLLIRHVPPASELSRVSTFWLLTLLCIWL